MYKKVWCTCKVVVLLIKPIVILPFSLRSPSSLLKLPSYFRYGPIDPFTLRRRVAETYPIWDDPNRLRPVSLFSVVRRANRRTRKMATRVTDGVSRLRRSRARALVSLNLKKKRDYSQSTIPRSEQLRFVTEIEPWPPSYVCAEALSGIVFVRAQSYISGIMRTYRKIPKISPGAYIFQRPFLRGLFLEVLIFGRAYLRREICVSQSIGLA